MSHICPWIPFPNDITEGSRSARTGQTPPQRQEPQTDLFFSMSSLASPQSRLWPRRKPLWKQREVLGGNFARVVFPLGGFPLLARASGIRGALGFLLLPTEGYVAGDSLEGHGVE